MFLAGLFMFGWTRRLGATRAGALVAGAAYMMAPYFVTLVYPGHDGKMFVDALAPRDSLADPRVYRVTPRDEIAGDAGIQQVSLHGRRPIWRATASWRPPARPAAA